VGRRHESRRLLVPGQDELDLRLPQRFDDIEVLLARNPEDPLDAFILQRGDKEVGAFGDLYSSQTKLLIRCLIARCRIGVLAITPHRLAKTRIVVSGRISASTNARLSCGESISRRGSAIVDRALESEFGTRFSLDRMCTGKPIHEQRPILRDGHAMITTDE
jgi:hypothetical protein